MNFSPFSLSLSLIFKFIFVRRENVPENLQFATPAQAGDLATFAAPEGLPRFADALLALGSPEAAVPQPSAHGGFCAMGMLEWSSMSYTPKAG